MDIQTVKKIFNAFEHVLMFIGRMVGELITALWGGYKGYRRSTFAKNVPSTVTETWLEDIEREDTRKFYDHFDKNLKND